MNVIPGPPWHPAPPRYSPSAVLFQDYETHLDWLAEALALRPATESVFDAVLASVASFPHDVEVVRQAATVRATLITGERIASHLRVVQASFAEVLTDFVKKRYPGTPNVDLVAEVAGEQRWPRHWLWRWRIGAVAAAPAISARSSPKA
jgi:AcrR family transcriptional regulator